MTAIHLSWIESLGLPSPVYERRLQLATIYAKWWNKGGFFRAMKTDFHAFSSSIDIEIAQKLSKYSKKRLFIAFFIWRIYDETWMLLRPEKFITESPFTNKEKLDHMPSKVWDEITYPFPSFNGCNVELWEWISSFNTYIIMNGITSPS